MVTRRPREAEPISEDLIRLPENETAFAALTGLLQPDPLAQTRPLVLLVGAEGSGKTRLITEATRQFASAWPQLFVVSVPARDFVPAPPVGKRGAEQLVPDWYACDDLHELARDRASQLRFLHLLDRLEQNHARVLLASRTPPRTQPRWLPQLVDRLHGGVAAFLQPPSETSRRKLVQGWAAQQGWNCPPRLANLIARHAPAAIQPVIACCEALAARSKAASEPISQRDVEQYFSKPASRRKMTIDRIAKETARQFAISVEEMKSEAREQSIVAARQAAMFLSRDMAGALLDEIGTYFGGRNHSTVLHGCRKAEARRRQDPSYDVLVAGVEERLR